MSRTHKLDREFVHWQILSLVPPPPSETTWHCYYAVSQRPLTRAKMARIVNKVYYQRQDRFQNTKGPTPDVFLHEVHLKRSVERPLAFFGKKQVGRRGEGGWWQFI